MFARAKAKTESERYPLSKQQAFDTPGDAFLAYYASNRWPRPTNAAKSFMAGHLIVFFSKLLFHLGEKKKNLAFRQMTQRNRNFYQCSQCANYEVVKGRSVICIRLPLWMSGRKKNYQIRIQPQAPESQIKIPPPIHSRSFGEESLNAHC